jgi:hypothetical protein
MLASTLVHQGAAKVAIGTILQSPQVRQIDFYIGYLHINSAGYNLVVNAVANGKIDVQAGGVIPGAGAMYTPDNRVFNFPDTLLGLGTYDNFNIVHESTHALISEVYSRSFGPVRDSLDEAAAYIAGALYLRYSGIQTPQNSPIFVKAHQIATNIQKGAVVPAKDEEDLRYLIIAQPLYYSIGARFTAR